MTPGVLSHRHVETLFGGIARHSALTSSRVLAPPLHDSGRTIISIDQEDIYAQVGNGSGDDCVAAAPLFAQERAQNGGWQDAPA